MIITGYGYGFGGVVRRESISSMSQIRDYAEASIEASLPQCKDAIARYTEVLTKAEEHLQTYNAWGDDENTINVLKDSLRYADKLHADCKSKVTGTPLPQVYAPKDYPPAPGTPPAPVPPVPPVVKKTSSTWLWLGLAIGAVYLLKKKKK